METVAMDASSLVENTSNESTHCLLQNEEEAKFTCPSPLVTEPADEDDEYGGPSSVEAEANSSDCGFDLEMGDIPEPSYPLSNRKRNSLDTSDQIDDDNETNLGGLFDLLEPSVTQGCSNNPELEESIKSNNAIAGICGFANFANTCYMNSGLQCLLATPTLVKFFIECFKMKANESEVSSCSGKSSTGLTDQFWPVVQNVWGGKYRQLKPVDFKETLADTYPQFRGSQQHDCQEFITLLLDTMHEELKQERTDQSECGTSMELHTPHSTEKSAPLSVGWISRHSSFDNGSSKKVTSTDPIPDGVDSRGSPAGSPKSFDSHSSLEDKVTVAIRHCPIPKEIKSGKFAEEEADQDEDDDTMDSTAGSSVGTGSMGHPTSNIIPPDNLRRVNVVRFSDDSLDKSCANNSLTSKSCPLSINDYLKESKTLNVNVLAEDDEEMNNEISFDSDKFSRHDKVRLRETIDNLNTGHVDIDDPVKSFHKRLKTTNVTSHSCCTNENGPCNCSTTGEVYHSEGNCDFNGIKRIRLDSADKEKNVQFERERLEEGSVRSGDTCISPVANGDISLDNARLKEAIEADRFWEKYLANNDTVIARTFQGQFKNTVVCTVCNFVSVSFEPFMYLPVPLPKAHLLQLEVTFVSAAANQTPLSVLLNMTHADNVSNLKEKIVSTLELSTALSNLSVVEVVDHHISRVVEDWLMLKHLKDDRSIYVIEVLGSNDVTKNCDSEKEVPASSGVEFSMQGSPARKSTDAPDVMTCSENPEGEAALTYQSCVICMEDLPVNEMRQHNACDCIMCCACIDRTIEHHQSDMDENSMSYLDGQIKCPGCRQDADPTTEFVTLDMVGKSKPRLRTFTLPVVHRVEFASKDEEKVPKTSVAVFGHPTLVSVANCVTGKALGQILEPACRLNGETFEFVLVNATGRSCSRCLFTENCRGCIRIPPSDPIKEFLLQPSDSIAVSYTGCTVNQTDLDRASVTDQHLSMNEERVKARLDLSDCLEAFSEREILDESNPWFCPVCRKHQCATKTLTVWRFPDFLIIYLKRFVYLNNSTGSLKLDKSVSFEVSNLDLTPFLSGPLQSIDTKPVFNMYGCVCHFGSVGGGHYTAYSRHLATGSWNYFDDGTICEGKVPGENFNDYSSAYILFYQRAGSHSDTQIPTIARQCQAFALDSNRLGNSEVESKIDIESDCIVNNDEDEEETRPDLSHIIRSLDTPPPS